MAVCPAADGLIDGRRAFRSHPGSTFGGLIVAPSLQRAPKLVELVSALNGQLLADGYELAELKQTSALFSRQPDEALEYALYQQGYTQETEISCWLPLDRPYEELRRAYSFNKRYDLKKAEKHGLSAAALETEEEIRQFHALLCLNLRKFDAVPVHTAEELIDFRHSGASHPGGDAGCGGLPVLFRSDQCTAHPISGHRYRHYRLCSLHAAL